jgi:hypothetical protein
MWKLKLFPIKLIAFSNSFLASFSHIFIFHCLLPNTSSRIQTSYVTVEPRSKSSGLISDASTTTPAALASSETASGGAAAAAATSTMPTGTPQHPQAYPQSQHPPPAYHHHHHHHHHPEHPIIPHKPSSHAQGKKSNPLRRSRIIITVQRTQDYTTWLEENESAGEEGHGHAHAPPFAASTPEPS